jgi:tetratricopeptide (TPR) repeat protein
MRKRYLLLALIFVLIAPVWAQALSTEDLNRLFTERKYEEIVQETSKMLAAEPDNPVLNLAAGRALADLKQYQKALPYLKRADREFPEKQRWIQGWALGYLGLCEYMTGDYRKAKTDLAAAVALNATANSAQFARNYQKLFSFDEYYNNWKMVESERFVFHFQPSAMGNIAEFIRDREEAFATINRFFGSRVPQRIHFYVYHSDAKLRERFGKESGFAYPAYFFIHSQYFFSIGHEITHVISYYYDTPPQRRDLINEGMAVYFDLTGENKLEMARYQLKKHRIEAFSLVRLWQDWKWLPNTVSYPVAGAFVKFLIEREGEAKFKRLIVDQRYENAQAVYGPQKLDALIREFEAELAAPAALEEIKEITMLRAYPPGDPHMAWISAKKPNSILLDIQFPVQRPTLAQIDVFLEKAGAEFELSAEGRERVSCVLYQIYPYYNDELKVIYGALLAIPDPEVAKLEPGVFYRLAPKRADSPYKWVGEAVVTPRHDGVQTLAEAGPVGVRGITELPFELIGNGIFIKAKINNSEKEYNFIFDTGAAKVVIDKEVMEELSEAGQSSETIVHDAVGVSQTAEEIRLKALKVGNISVTDCPAFVLDLDELEALGIKVHGVLGNSFLKHFLVKIDYNQKTLTLSTKTDTTEFDRGYTLKLIQESEAMISTEIKVGDSSLIARIDTGNLGDNYLSFPIQELEKIKPQLNCQSIKSIGAVTGGLFGRSDAICSRLSTMELGGFKVDNLPVQFSRGKNIFVTNSFLSHFLVTINYPQLQMNLLPYENKPLRTNLTSFGFSARRDESGKVKIIGLWEGSPAELNGLKVGDEITGFRVEGRNVTFEDIGPYLYGEQPNALHLQIVNNSGKREVKLEKANLLPEI